MWNSLRIIILTITTVTVSCNRSPGQENYEIRRINFKGNNVLSNSFLRDELSITPSSFFTKFFARRQPSLFSERVTATELERLLRTYQSEGFINAEVSLLPLQINHKRQTVRMTIAIREGEPVKIDSISLNIHDDEQGQTRYAMRKSTLGRLEMKPGKRFRDASLNSDMTVIRDALRNRGYAYAEVDFSLGLDTLSLRTSVHYTATPGIICYFGETSISNDSHISESFVRRQLAYREGDLYRQSLLDKTRSNLNQLFLFRIVSVIPQSDPVTQRNPIPVNINLEKAARLNFRVGAGFGTEDKFRTFLELNYRGFLGTASHLNLYLKHSALEPYYGSLKWTFPQFPIKNSTFTINPFISRNSEPGYETRAYGINLPITYRFHRFLNGSLSYYFENVRQIEGDTPDMEEENFPYFKSGVLIGALYNNSRPMFSPRQGIYFQSGLKINGYTFSSDFNYFRLWGDFRTYMPWRQAIVALRTMVGGIRSNDESGFIPVEDRFYSGGMNSIRGWDRSQLGPKRDNGTPMGGKSIIEGNLELRQPVIGRIGVVMFFDAGNVWTGSFSYNLNDLAYAGGGGLRVETPIGPIRFDVGFPLWNQQKGPRFFISVGQAF